MRAEKLLKDAGFSCKLIPVPRQLSSDCGICLSIPYHTANEVRAFLEMKKLHFDDFVPHP
jgi:hypothetical protein